VSILQSLKEQKEKLQEKVSSGELIQAFQVPVKLPFKGGSLRMYVTLDASQIQTQEELLAALEQLDAACGVDVYLPQQRQQFGFNKPSYNRGWSR
jgi:hypothetical protein